MNLKELSQTLGLSQTTVSRALNGYPEVSEATRQRVEAAARTHNYRPNTRAKSLATGQAMAIGHVIPLATRHEMVNPVFADFIAGAAGTYARHGYEMVLSVIEDGEIAAPEDVFFGFADCQEKLNLVILERATLRASVEIGADVSARLITLVRELKSHLVED